MPVIHEDAGVALTLMRFIYEPLDEAFTIVVVLPAVMLQPEMYVRKDSNSIEELLFRLCHVFLTTPCKCRRYIPAVRR